jgi:DNA repair photolyase
MGLKHIDHWYWCRYFIDVYPECPYGCSYCNTRKRKSMGGINFYRGLPRKNSTVGLGLISDIYHPDPAFNRVATEILEILLRKNYRINIQTKSSRIVHDLKLLENFALNNSIRVTFTILSPDAVLSRQIEGNAPDPQERLKSLSALTKKGIPAGIAVTPVIPFLTDDQQSLTELVRTAKDMGAGWVLFSGFNPLKSFYQNPVMVEKRHFHQNERFLNRRYREIKEFMIDLLHREGLPFRIPRLNPEPGDVHHEAGIVSEYLFNISYYYELLEDSLQSLRYRRAAFNIDSLDESLKSIVFRKKLGYIKGINPEIESIIKEIIMQGTCSLFDELKETLSTRV